MRMTWALLLVLKMEEWAMSKVPGVRRWTSGGKEEGRQGWALFCIAQHLAKPTANVRNFCLKSRTENAHDHCFSLRSE